MAVKVSNLNIDNESPLTLIAGPCVIESKDMIHDIAGKIKEITESLGMGYIFKSSFDKANRTSINSFRGPGMEEGLSILESVMKLAEKFSIPIISIIDTPGAFPGVGAEERGQSEAIARNLFTLASLQTPIINLVLGEGGSGGALAIGMESLYRSGNGHR